MNKKHLSFALLLLTAVSCTERIDIQLDETQTRLVVDGCITTDSACTVITLTKTSGYFSNKPSPGVTGASVTLFDGVASHILLERDPGQPGVYSSVAPLPGVTGREYTLHIELAEPISGSTSFDASCALNPVARIDSVTTSFHADWGKEGFWAINIYAMEPANAVNYYMLSWFRNGVPMSDSIHKKIVMDDQLVNGRYMYGLPVIYIDNSNASETLRPGDTITLQMSGITKEYMNFVTQVQMAGFNLPFFTGPPANVEGNIGNGGLGCFTAYSNVYATTVVR